jgi:hypothetical protein
VKVVFLYSLGDFGETASVAFANLCNLVGLKTDDQVFVNFLETGAVVEKLLAHSV